MNFDDVTEGEYKAGTQKNALDGNDIVWVGTASQDQIDTALSVLFLGGAGNDAIDGGTADENLVGNECNDYIEGNGADNGNDCLHR